MLARGCRRQADRWSRKAVPLATVRAACLPASAQMRTVIPDDACAVLARSHKVAGKCMPALSCPDQGTQAHFESCGVNTFCSVRGANAMRPLQAAAYRVRQCTGPVRIAVVVVVVVGQVCLGSLIDDDVQQSSSADGARPRERGPKRTEHHGWLYRSLSLTAVSSRRRLAIDSSGRFDLAPGGLRS